MKYRELTTSVLRAALSTFTSLGVCCEQRDAIRRELAVRAWAAAIEERMDEVSCVWTERGGRS